MNKLITNIHIYYIQRLVQFIVISFGGSIMSYYIGIEDLAANALIEILSRYDKRFVSYKDLEEYGAEVFRILREKDEKVVFILSRDRTNDMFRNYSDIFFETKHDLNLGIELKNSVTVDELIEKFRGYLAWDVLLAFVNESSLAKIGIAA